jgi:hypothetical protein
MERDFDIHNWQAKYLRENSDNFNPREYLIQKAGKAQAEKIETQIKNGRGKYWSEDLWNIYTNFKTPQEVLQMVNKYFTQNENTIQEEMDFESSSQIQAVINYLIDNERQDVLDVLGEIPEWNELVDQAADI